MGKSRHKNRPWMCGQCKHGFQSQDAVRMHIADKHPTIKNCGIYHRVEQITGPEYEESYADRAIGAELAMAMGEPTDDGWLLGE